jgi:hypothetical protein
MEISDEMLRDAIASVETNLPTCDESLEEVNAEIDGAVKLLEILRERLRRVEGMIPNNSGGKWKTTRNAEYRDAINAAKSTLSAEISVLEEKLTKAKIKKSVLTFKV